jgi:hypothetical protein
MLDQAAAEGLAVVQHLDVGDDPGWTIQAVREGSVKVVKGDRSSWIDVPTFDWSPAATAEQGRALYLSARPVEWTREQLERWAVFQYTASRHRAINAVVSGKDPEGTVRADLERWLRSAQGIPPGMTVDRLIRLLSDALERLPPLADRARVLTKGVNLETHGEVEPRYTVEEHAEGREYEVAEFTSTSLGNPFVDRDSLVVYEPPEGPDAPPHAGKEIPADYTPSGNEAEVLFPPGLRYRVLEVAERGTPRFEALLREHGVAGDAPKLRRIVRVRILPRRAEV